MPDSPARLLRSLVLAALAFGAMPAHAVGPEHVPAYVAGPAVTLPSGNTGWDYITLDQATGRLFIARRADGLTVWDTRADKVLATVEDSAGANGVVLVPEFNRGYAVMTDGTVLAFDLATLRPIERVRLDDGDLNQGFYDPATKRVHMVVGTRPARTTWISLDAATGKVLGRTEFDSKMDDPAQDGRGDKPVFLVLDPADGRTVASLPIGRGVDGMTHDEERHLIVAANGVDGTMSVIRQDGPDKYSLVETVATRSMARVIAMDGKTGRLFTVPAGYSQPAAGPDGKLPPPVSHKDSFTVMSYVPG